MPLSPRVCLVWPRLGPYHLARVAGAHARWTRAGGEAVALDVATRDDLYDWDVEDAPTPFRREVAFPGASYDALGPAEMEAGVMAALDRIDADAVAVPSYSTPDARAVIAWCRRRHRTAVMLYESRADDASRSAPREAIKSVLVRQFDACLASGDAHADYAAALGMPRGAIVTGASVVDNAAFAAGAEAARRTPERWVELPGLAPNAAPFFLASNRFIERKNLPALVRAFRAYRSHAEAEGRAPWRLVLLGDGDGRADLERLAGPESEGVVFAGFQQADVLPAYYGLAGAFVHPATLDQWALVINEAAAAGLPLVVSDGTGAAPDLVDEGSNGFTFPAADEAALARALDRIASLPDAERAAFGDRSRILVERFTPETYGEALWHAVQRGRPRADRGLSLAARAILAVFRRGTRNIRAGHTVES